MTAFDLVLFDLDGTLVDTLPDIAAALGAALSEAGVPTPPVDVVKSMVGDGARELIRKALAVDLAWNPQRVPDLARWAAAAKPPSPDTASVARDLDALHASFLAHYRAHVSDRSTVYAGVPEALAALRAAGVMAAVVTNKPGDIARRLLDDVGLTPQLTRVIGDDDGFPRKPDPTAAGAIIAAAGTTAARTAVVGDGLPDVRLGHAVGATTVAAGWGYVAPERLAAESPAHLARTPEEAARYLIAYTHRS
jgi:phosphoglycolate phosphatase